jgi:phosphoglycerate-specific signal transduction histidine kinase
MQTAPRSPLVASRRPKFFSLRLKLLAVFCIILTLATVVSLFAIRSLQDMGQQAGASLDQRVDTLDTLTAATAATARARTAITHLELAPAADTTSRRAQLAAAQAALGSVAAAAATLPPAAASTINTHRASVDAALTDLARAQSQRVRPADLAAATSALDAAQSWAASPR